MTIDFDKPLQTRDGRAVEVGMTDKHTPGPWFVGQPMIDENLPQAPATYTIGPFEAECHYEDTICEVWDGNYPGEANARLIAKAWLIPDLLEALRECADEMRRHIYPKPDVPEDHPYRKLQRAEAVIAKAEGRDE